MKKPSADDSFAWTFSKEHLRPELHDNLHQVEAALTLCGNRYTCIVSEIETAIEHFHRYQHREKKRDRVVQLKPQVL